MENYTKYRLKDAAELTGVLSGTDKIFVVACNKCFKEFESVDEPDCEAFVKLAEEQGKTVTGAMKVDFLCNRIQTERKLADGIPEGTECVFVVSCGLGIQTMAELVKKPVFAASNSLNYTGHHGMALTKKACDACAQCFLNITGGICPVVDCSKSLLNGQCGGAKNGKCEVDPNKDCAWEKIYRKLEATGRLEEFEKQPVQLRDYSKINFDVIHKFVQSIRDKRLDGYYGGGNQNLSYYPFVAYIEESDGLENGMWMDVTLNSAGSDSLFIESMYVRESGGSYYVYAEDAETGLLEKRTVRVGKDLYDSYIEIKSGLAADDYIAVPYGKNVRAGVKTQHPEEDAYGEDMYAGEY